MKYVLTALISATLAFTSGFVVAYGFGQSAMERNQFNLALRDGRSILAEVRAAAPIVQRVHDELGAVIDDPMWDARSLDALVAVKRPADDMLFRQRRYMAFRPATVDDLLRYYLGVVFIWDRLAYLRELAPRLRAQDENERQQARLSAVNEARELRGQISKIIRIQSALLQELTAIANLPNR